MKKNRFADEDLAFFLVEQMYGSYLRLIKALSNATSEEILGALHDFGASEVERSEVLKAQAVRDHFYLEGGKFSSWLFETLSPKEIEKFKEPLRKETKAVRKIAVLKALTLGRHNVPAKTDEERVAHAVLTKGEIEIYRRYFLKMGFLEIREGEVFLTPEGLKCVRSNEFA